VKQNVSASVAVTVIVVAIAIFFVVFNRPAPPSPGEMMKPLPYAPEVDASKNADIRKGLRPLGVLAVFPPVAGDRSKGVRLAAVIPGSPAEQGGLQAGDLVTGFSGKQIGSQDALIYLLSLADPKQSYSVEFVRSGKTQQVTVTGIRPLPPEELAGFGFPRPAEQRPGGAGGGGPR
jgi:S1-C subfamily serine protease